MSSPVPSPVPAGTERVSVDALVLPESRAAAWQAIREQAGEEWLQENFMLIDAAVWNAAPAIARAALAAVVSSSPATPEGGRPECPDHKPVQHRDGKPPWCSICGWTDGQPAIAPRQVAIPNRARAGSRDATEPQPEVVRADPAAVLAHGWPDEFGAGLPTPPGEEK